MDTRLMIGLLACWFVLSPIFGIFIGFSISRAKRLNRPRMTEVASGVSSDSTAFNLDDVDAATPSIFQSIDDDNMKGTMSMIAASSPSSFTSSRQRH